SRAQHGAWPRSEQPRFRAVQELRDVARRPAPVPVRVVQLLQPHAVRRREHEPAGQHLWRRDVGAAGPHQPVWDEAVVLDEEAGWFYRQLPTSNSQLPSTLAAAGEAFLGVGSWDLGVDARRLPEST